MLAPIVKWSGGKSDEIKHFEKYIPKEYNYYLEPFFGGGAVYFYLSPKKAIVSDVHPELVNLYNSIKKKKSDDIYQFMEKNPNLEAKYYEIRDELNDISLHTDPTPDTELESAKRFYYIRKTCYRGMLRYNKSGYFNVPFGRYKTINYDVLQNKEYEKLFENTLIYNKDYSYIFDNYNDKENFMFLDPPYDSVFTDYGYCQFDREEQKKLAKKFKETNIRCLMVIGKTDFIVEQYKDYIVAEFQKNYKFKLHSNRVGAEINNKHLIIKNY